MLHIKPKMLVRLGELEGIDTSHFLAGQAREGTRRRLRRPAGHLGIPGTSYWPVVFADARKFLCAFTIWP
jgi:hypothetical protein